MSVLRVAALLMVALFLCGTVAHGLPGLRGATPGVAVVVLHQIAPEDDPAEPYVASSAALKKMIVRAREAGYTFISLDDFHAFMEGHGKLPQRSVLLTFDDSYEGVLLEGHPVLAALECPAVMFAITKWFSLYPRPEFSAPHLTQEEAKAMLDSGLWGFGGHTHDGHRLLTPGPENEPVYFATDRQWLEPEGRYETQWEYLARVWADIELMSLELRRLGVEPCDFAPPYGRSSPELEHLLREAGYRFIYVSGTRLNYPGQTYVYRVDGGTSAGEFLRNLNAAFESS